MLRILQNFFAGIEYINSATYLIESCRQESRGYYGSWTAIGICGGYLLASIVAVVISYFISLGIIPPWGWRFIFLFSIFGIIFGFWLRYSIPESLSFIMNNTHTEPLKKSLILKNSTVFIGQHLPLCFAISALTLLGAFLSYIYYIYIPINLVILRGFSIIQAFSINVASLSLIVVLIPLFGKLSDNYNRNDTLKYICFLIMLMAIPFFWVSAYGSFYQILFMTLSISVPSACIFSFYPVIITESFPSKIRCTTASFVYQVIVSIEMGILPFLINYLDKKTQIPYVTGYIFITITIISLFGLTYLKNFDANRDIYLKREFIIE